MAAATGVVKGGFWPANGVNTLSQIDGRSPASRQIAQRLGRRGMLLTRELMVQLNGVAPGAAALKTLGRVQASTELGGKRVIETDTIVNRVTAAGDVTAIAANLLTYTTRTTFGASPKANLDGNPLGTR